jgi:competence protein ComEC
MHLECIATMGRAVLTLALTGISSVGAHAEFVPSGLLEIHYINVGQGASTLLIGPDGTRILYDMGDRGRHERIIHYLQTVARIHPEDGLHYTFVSHPHQDHYFGFRGIVSAGYDVLVANYGNGSPKSSVNIDRQWRNPAQNKTSSGAVRAVPVGLKIALGGGATLAVVAANGKVVGDRRNTVVPARHRPKDENDRSIGVLIDFGKFQYILDGDMGAGKNKCENRTSNNQNDIQGRVGQALVAQRIVSPEFGVDILHVAHHGSQTSTSTAYVNMLMPEVALISVGGESRGFYHPRKVIVDGVLAGRDQNSACKTVRPLHVGHIFQTEEGEAHPSDDRMSTSALAVGDIKVVTDGQTAFLISGNNNVFHGKGETLQGGWCFRFDEDGGGVADAALCNHLR